MLKKSTSKSALMVALVTGNVIWGGTVVHAEEPSQAFTLDPMVVTAQRMETKQGTWIHRRPQQLFQIKR